MNAVFWQPNSTEFSSSDDRYKVFAPIFADCHLTLVEGDTHTDATKIEVWRKSLGKQPLAIADTSILAVVTHDDVPNLAAPVWSRADVVALAEKIFAITQD